MFDHLTLCDFIAAYGMPCTYHKPVRNFCSGSHKLSVKIIMLMVTILIIHFDAFRILTHDKYFSPKMHS